MSLICEGVGTGEITADNFGEVLLFAYAGYLRLHTNDQSRSKLLQTYADQLDEKAVADQQGLLLPETGPPSDELLLPITEVMSQAVALRALADRVRARSGVMFDNNDHYRAVANKLATLTHIDGRPGYIAKGVGWPRYPQEATGQIGSMYLGSSHSEIVLEAGGIFDTTWRASPLIDRRDFCANFTIQFHS